MTSTKTNPAEYALNHWKKFESSEEHAYRVERAEHTAGSYFQEATKRQRAVYDRTMADLRGLAGPRYERARIEAKAVWTRSTVEAADLFTATCDAIMAHGEVPEEMSAEWDALCAREAVAAVMEAA
jgi:hypothetical protein